MQRIKWWKAGVAVLATTAATVLVNVPAAHGAVPLQKIIDDPFTGGGGQHKAAVEPDTFAFGNTIMVAAQVGRFFAGGSTDIGYARSTDGGTTWTQGTLPGITSGGGTYERVSDATVAYDAAHGVWLISSLPVTASVAIPAILVSRSTDGGATSAIRSRPPRAPAWTRIGRSATTIRPAPTTATATPSSTITPTRTGSR